MPPNRRARRMVSRAVAITLLISTAAVEAAVSAPAALAAGTVLFNQPFHDNTVDGPVGSVSIPGTPSGTNTACLSAAGNAVKNPLASCSSATDAQGSGKLRLTSATTSQEGGIFASTSVPTSQGLDVTFNSYQYGGNGADGLAFVLAGVDPANPATPSVIGQSGGALGYSAQSANQTGLSHGYLGVGIDPFGNFSNKFEGTGCTDPPNIAQKMPGQVVVRGPGNGTVGYCALQSSAATATSPPLTLRATTRAASLVPVEVVFNPTSSAVTTASGLTVPAGDYDVTFTPIGGKATSLVSALPVVPSGLYPSSWVNANGIPKQLAFGWVGSTGSVTDFHEIDNVVVSSFTAVPQLAVSQTSYMASTLTPGTPVTYTVAASSTGAPENLPVTVTETLPAGVLPVGASGPGWACGAPSGQTISCTNSTSPFTSGTITVNGVVTSSSLTPDSVRNATSALVSSGDASPATSSSAPAGTVPTAPNVTSISPTNGAAGGNNSVTVSGTNLSGATAIEIGTAAEFTAGKPTTLVLCSAPAPGCFTVTSSTSLAISSMPAHVAAAVTVRVVSLGIAGSVAYTYNPGPALLFPAPPAGEVGVSYSDQLAVTGGTSPFTWSVSVGSLPPGLTLGASTGLLSGTPTAAGSFTFTVKVADSSGLSDTKTVTLTIIPGPSLNFPAPPSGWTRTVYSDTLTVSGGTSPFAWTVSAGSLPPGISLSASGNLTGTPTATGTFGFTVNVTDANGQSATQATSITIAAGVSTTFAAPPAGQVGIPYTDTLTATGGTTPYTWSVNAGTLPPGLTLNSAGVLAGTPTTAGSFTFTVNVIDANNGIATTSITLTVGSAALTIALAADTSSVAAGGTVHYTITATNSGSVAYTGAALAASLSGIIDDASYNGDAAATAGTVSFASPNLTWTGNLAVGASVTITYSVTVKNPDPGDGLLKATVTSSTTGNNCPAGSTDTRCSATVTVSGLTILQSADVSSAAPGGTVHYTVTVTNSGQTPFTGAAFTDPLSGVLDDATYNGDAAATAGSVSFTSPSLTWTGNLAAGAVATITFSVTVKNPDTGNGILASTVTSATAGSNCPSGGTDARCTATVTVSGLTITNTANASSTTPGSTVRYTIAITNTGQTALTGAVVTDSLSGVLDDAAYNGDAAATAGAVTFVSPNLSWTGNLAPGAVASVTFSVTVASPDTGNKTLTAAITSATPGSNCPTGGSDARCTATVTVLTPGLTVTKTADVSTTSPGSVVHYTITVADTGQTPYTGATFTDSLSGVLEDAAYDGNAAATTGSVAFASPNLTWTGNLAVGGTATITYSVTVSNPDTGDRSLVNTVTSTTPGSNCPAGSSDSRCTATVTDLVPALAILKTADKSTATPGQVVHYTVTVTNTGQTSYTGASFSDPLSGVLDDAAYNGDAAATAGTVSFASPTLSWTGNLAPGAVATVSYSVTVSRPDTGNHVLANTVVSATPGNNCPSGGTDPDCTATVKVADLVIVNQANVASTVPGGVVRYTATFTNAGQVPYTGITVATDATNVFDDAVPNGDQTATSGTLTVTSTGVTWAGDIPVGGSVTVTGTVTVKNPDTGNKTLTATLISAAAGNNCPAGGTDPRCTSTVPVLTPALTIVKTANTTAAVPGGTVGYTITVTNTGQTPYSGATVHDSFAQMADDAVYDGNATASSGSVSFASPVLTWTGNLAPGAAATISYTVTVNNPDTGDKQVINTVSSPDAGATCPPGATTAACRVTVGVLTPALDIVKTANVSTITPGGIVHYTITVTNTGQVPYTGASFTDPLTAVLDEADYNGNASATAGTVSFTSPVLSWTGDLAPGAAATITYSVTVHNPETGDLVLNNTVSSTTPGSDCASGSADPDCSVAVEVVDATTLTITKTADVASTKPGGVVHYTVKVANSGLTPYLGAAFTDPLSGVLDDAAYNGDASATAGTVTFSSPDLSWTGDVPASGSVTVTYSVTVHSPDTGNMILANTVSSDSPGSDCAAGSGDPRCSSTVTVSQLAIDFTASVATVTPGGTVSYVATLHNTGQTPYFGISVATDATGIADDATSNGDETASSGTLSVGPTGAVWTGDIPVGGTVTVSSSVTVNNPDTGNHVLTATAVSAAPGNNCPAGGTDPHCTPVTNVLTPALTIVKTASTTTAVPGAVIGYTITVTNTGQTTYTGATVNDSFAEMADDAVYNGDATAATGSLSFASSVLTWTGNLAPGAVVTISYTVTVNNPDTGDKAVINTVSSPDTGATCPPGATTAACRVTVPVLTPALTIVKTADTAASTPGGIVHYTVTVTNTGQTAYTGAAFTDPLSGVLDDAAYNGNAAATSGSVAFASPVLSWTGDLAVGAAATITYSVTVHNPDTGNHVLANTVTSATPGSNCASRSADPRCTATVSIAELTIDFTASVATVTPGGTVRYVATLHNTGQTPYFGISVATDATGIADDATSNGDETASSGTLSLGPTGAVWTGDIPVGGTVTISSSVTVNNPDAGDHVLTATAVSAAPGNNCPAGGTDPRCTPVTNVLIPALTIVKTASTTATVPGGTVGYTITVTNTGQTTYTGATVSDSFAQMADDAAYNGDATATSGSLSFASPVLTWTGNLAPRAVATITYTVTANNPDTGDKLFINSVSSTDTGSTCPPGATTAACRVTIAVLTPALHIVKTADTATSTPGGIVHYTITVTNTGQVPYTGATFTDPLNGVLDDAAYNGNAAATAGTVSFASPVLSWTGNLAAGAVVTVTYSVTVHNPDTGNHVLANSVTSTTTGSNCPSGGADPACTATVQIGELTIVNTASVATTTPGGIVRYTIVAINTGQVPISDATFTAHFAGVFDDATYNNDASATAGVLTVDTTAGTTAWTGDLAPGESVTVTESVTVNSPDNGNKILTETTESATPGNNCPPGGSDPRCSNTVNVLIPALTITKAANASTTTPGSIVDYTITIANTGQTPYTGASITDDLTGVLNDAAFNNDAAATTGTAAYSSPNLTWTGDLAVGASAVVSYSVTVSNPDTGDRVLVNTVTSATAGSNCPAGRTDPACTATVHDLIPALAMTKTADTTSAVPGGVVGYMITVANTGQTAYTGAQLTDHLNAVLDDATYNSDATATVGTVTFTSPTLTWTGNLAVGATATITYTVTVAIPDTGDKSLANTVTSADAGSTCPPAGPGPACTVDITVLTPALTISKTASASQVVAGSTVGYSIVVDNTGQVPYSAAAIADPLSGVLNNAAYNADAAATIGTVSFANGVITWTGNLPVNATAVITYSVTTNSADASGTTLTNTVSSAVQGNNCGSGSTDPACTATVTVLPQAIALSNLTSSFTLSGPPGANAEQDGAVTMTVTTNSPSGYQVTVQPATPDLASSASTDTIPFGDLSVRGTVQDVFQPLTGPVLVHNQSGPSAPAGDLISNDYQISIPDVRAASYHGTLDYIATTNP